MKKLVFLTLLPSLIFAQIKFYTISTTTVGPGAVHRHIIAPEVPWNINVLEIDLNNPFTMIETVKANNQITGREQTSAMADRISEPGHHVIGAINGDFWGSDGTPLGTQIINGQILKNPNYWSTIGVDELKRPMIGIVAFQSSIHSHSVQGAISGINEIRDTDELILYNRYYGSSTKTNQHGTEMRIIPLEEWVVNDSIVCVVDTLISGAGNMNILSGGAVLSGHGSSADFLLNHFSVDDTIKLYLGLQPGLRRMMQLVSGFPRIVNDGENYALEGYANEGGSSDFAVAYHPRSSAGFNADSTRLYLVAVDGRQSISRGMSLPELADFLIDLGVTQAVNLDGGGSTTLVVRDNIVNFPSDGSERPVANVLTAVSTALTGELAYIQISPDYFRPLIEQEFDFKISHWDENYTPLPADTAQYTFVLDPALGTIDTYGHFRASGAVDSGFVFVHYLEYTDSAYIRIKTLKSIHISPKYAVVDSLGKVNFQIEAYDEDGLSASLDANRYSWNSLNPDVGSVDSVGVFTGLNKGEATVVVQFEDLSDTAFVSVQYGESKAVLDSMQTLGNWNMSGIMYDESASAISIVDTPHTIGNGALCLNYQFIRSAESRSYINLNTDISIYGVPDSIFVDVKSDGERHWVNLIVSDDNDELFKASTGQFADVASFYDTLAVATDDLFAILPSSDFHFPIRFKTIEIRLGYNTAVGDTNRGTIYFDNLRVTYPDVMSAIPIYSEDFPRHIQLFQNYPNPFNAQTLIEFATAYAGIVKLSVYDVLGRKVTDLVNRPLPSGVHRVSWESGNLASGVYLYKLETKDATLIRKMILLK